MASKAGRDLWPYLEQARELLAVPAGAPGVQPGNLAAVESSISSLVTKHSGTQAAACGQYYLGSIAFYRGDYEGSIARFKEGIRSGKAEGVLALLLLKGEANSLEAKGDFAAAAVSYRKAAETAGPQLKSRLNFGEGRVLELSGKRTEAASLYRKTIKENPDSRIKDLIDIKLSRME
jgi:tetratricopeptide (TPR) repeat protein